MDVLRNIIIDKSNAVPDKYKTGSSGSKWFKRSVLAEQAENKALELAREAEEKQYKLEEKRLREFDEYLDYNTNHKQLKKSSSVKVDKREPGVPVSNISNDTATMPSEEKIESPDMPSLQEEQTADDIPMERSEVIRRLRKKGEVTTYFGETDRQRYDRLCQLEIASHGDEMLEGQRNIFLQLMGDKAPSNITKNAHEDEDDYPDKFMSANKDCKEARVLSWMRKMLDIWAEELNQRTESEKSSTAGKVKTAQLKQTQKDLLPLIRKLRQRRLDQDILDKLHEMTVFCDQRSYREAHDKYIELSIGNAAWPMGVTMVGIHERAGRSKIFTSEIAHVLNDETTRKYIHMIKRLISLAQRKFPTDPSKMVSLSSVHI